MNDADVFNGIRVLDFSQGMAGPYCGQLLAHYGADVVKVEPPAGDWLRANAKRFRDHSAQALVAGRGKRSLALDLKLAQGQLIARQLLAGADVMLENNRPGVMARPGLDHDVAQAINPDIIYLSVTGFGQSGPYTHRPAVDTVMQAYTGLIWANVGGDGVLHRVGTLVPDMVTTLYGFQGVAVALYAKAMGRRGRFLAVSLMQAMAAFRAYKLIETALEGSWPEVLAVPSGTYPTAAGWISLAVINEARWPRLATALGRPDLIDDQRFTRREARRAHALVLNDIIITILGPSLAPEQVRRLQQGTTALMVSIMRKPVEGAAVLVEHMNDGSWSIAGAVGVGAHVEATIALGMNTPDEKARFMAEMWTLLRSALGTDLREETYIVFHEIDTKAYGRGRLTRAERDRRCQVGGLSSSAA